MDNFDSISMHYTINNILILIFQLAIIASSIFIVTKYRKSIGAKIMLIGTILNLISITSFQVVPILMNDIETDSFLMAQVFLSYLNTFTFFVFAIGYAIFAINDLKKDRDLA